MGHSLKLRGKTMKFLEEIIGENNYLSWAQEILFKWDTKSMNYKRKSQ